MIKKFTERTGMNLYAVNEEVLKEWDETDLFHKSIAEREGCPAYVFFEGPPSANGHPGIHHVMARTIKGRVLPLQNDARLPSEAKSRLGHARPAG